jgi:hypothetical protein
LILFDEETKKDEFRKKSLFNASLQQKAKEAKEKSVRNSRVNIGKLTV